MVEEEKESMNLYLGKLTEELKKAEDELKEATVKIPNNLSHLTDQIKPVYSWSNHSWSCQFKPNVVKC